MKKEKPLSLIGHWIDGPAYDQLQHQGEEFIRSCMINKFVLTAQEQQVLFGIIQRIEEINWEHGTYPRKQSSGRVPPVQSRLKELLDTIKKDDNNETN